MSALGGCRNTSGLAEASYRFSAWQKQGELTSAESAIRQLKYPDRGTCVISFGVRISTQIYEIGPEHKKVSLRTNRISWLP